MNILLADIQSPGLDLRELPPVDESVAREFAGMLRHSLDDFSGGELQVFDFNELYSQVDETDPAPLRTPTGGEDSAWRAYLAQTQIQVTIDTDAVAMGPSEAVAGEQSDPAVATAPTLAQTLIDLNTGDDLPPGGNGLPPRSPSSAQPGSLQEPIAVAAAMPSTPPASAPGRPVGVGHGELGTSLEAGLKQVGETAKPDAIRNGAVPRPGAEQATGASPATRLAQAELPAGKADLVTVDAAARSVAPVQAGAPGAETRAAALTRAEVTPGVNPDSAASRPVMHVSDGPLPRSSRETLPLHPVQVTLPTNDQSAAPIARGVPASAASSADHAPGNSPAAVMNQAGSPAPTAEPAMSDLPLARAVDTLATNNAGTAQTVTPTVVATHLHNPAPAQPGNALPSAVETLTLARPNDPAAWGQGLGERVSWMVNHQQNSASIRLDPPMLGKLDVQIRMADDSTTISIQTQHPQTRDLVEASAARLRDFLQESGFQNVNVDVSQRQEQQQARAALNPDGDADAVDDGDEANDDAASSAGVVNAYGSLNLVDTFV